MSHLAALKSAGSLHGVAHLLGFKPKALAYILYKKNDAEKYTQFQIPKRSGGFRTISAPSPDLMIMQKRLSELLQDCIKEINESREVKTTLSHGFKRNYSIITNANLHKNKRFVFNIDLENFFGTINFGRVRGYFIKNRNFELPPPVATVIAQIACHDNALPQGSPCSPVISNLIGHLLDIRLARLAYNNSCTYSRYADDLTFSTNEKKIPEQIARLVAGEEHFWQPGTKLDKIIQSARFKINPSKTRMLYQDSRQDVTGLVVNAKVNVRSDYWRTARAMAHRLFRTGTFQIKRTCKDENGETSITETNGTIEQLNGILSFIDSIDFHNDKIEARNGNKNNQRKNNPHNSRQAVYKRFLLYKNFYSAPTPLIICEGKTDNVYLKAAIRRLHPDFPQLAGIDSDGKFLWKVKFYNYTRTSKRVSHLGGGAGDLKTLIGSYKKECKYYANLEQQSPIIILVDNDDGAKSIFGVVRNILGTTVDGSQPFYVVRQNLYLVAVPKLDNKGTKIEDFFPPEWLAHEINGKKFNPDLDSHGTTTEYSKQVFSEQVVKKNQGKIDFSNFRQILERISAVIDAH